MLQVRSLSRAFGGVKAVDDVSFDVTRGAIHAVIGPNGAGKTTLFNLITGMYTPSGGEVELDGQGVTGMPPEALARLGMRRTFQNLQVCMNMSAVENVMVGAHLRCDSSFRSALLRLPSLHRAERELHEEARELMRFVGLGTLLDSHASQLSYGALKRLEIARALIGKPKLLLLDEPAAGLNHTETDEIASLIRRANGTGVTVVLVEHDMKLVMSIAQRILVMENGCRLAEGTPGEVRSNLAVIAAYLGADTESEHAEAACAN